MHYPDNGNTVWVTKGKWTHSIFLQSNSRVMFCFDGRKQHNLIYVLHHLHIHIHLYFYSICFSTAESSQTNL